MAAYSKFGLTAMPRLAGRVHGVVVQMRKKTRRGSSSSPRISRLKALPSSVSSESGNLT
jgi:hypothetical protein